MGRGVAASGFAEEFHCDDFQTYSLGNDVVRIEGCGRSETYVCESHEGHLERPTAEPGAFRYHDTPSGSRVYEPEPDPALSSPTITWYDKKWGEHSVRCVRQQLAQSNRPVPPPQRREAAPQVPSEVRSEKLANGEVRLVLELGLDGQSLLTLSTSSQAAAAQLQARLLRSEVDHTADACGLDWFVDGQPLSVAAPSSTRHNEFLERRQVIPVAGVQLLASAQKLTLRSCRHRWSLKPQQLDRVHELAARIQPPSSTPPVVTEQPQEAPADDRACQSFHERVTDCFVRSNHQQ